MPASFWSRLLRRVRRALAPAARDRAVGNRGEAAAADLLRARGYRIIARNAVTPRGEADLVAWAPDGRTLVVVEVKTRVRGANARSDATPPEANVTRAKRRRLHAIATHLARSNGWTDRPRRVDVVGVEIDPDGSVRARVTERV
ncbi:MAG: YraN family protein [Planctomycetota bacterium]|nr:YraN family protein [Planctomycetota bacterium]